jgi:hypothetical protein
MHDPISLREQARKCRALSKTAVEPEVIEQLRVWAVELAEEADQTEWPSSRAHWGLAGVPRGQRNPRPRGGRPIPGWPWPCR